MIPLRWQNFHLKCLCVNVSFKEIYSSLNGADLHFSLALGIRVLVDAREKLHIPWGKPSNQQHGDTVMAFDTRSAMAQGHGMVEHKVFQHYLPSIRALWADEGIQNAYDRRREFQLVSYTVCQHLHQEKNISVYHTRQNVLNARFSKG